MNYMSIEVHQIYKTNQDKTVNILWDVLSIITNTIQNVPEFLYTVKSLM